MRKQFWILLLIFLLALGLRLWHLGSLPAGFTADEASHGYDAFSLLKTGKDQWGVSWPLAFRSFGDFKLPVYSYMLIPFVWLGGLTEFIVRLPNAILGSLAVVMTFLFTKELFKENIFHSPFGKGSEAIPLMSALLLAISPWHIQMSRTALEANLTSFFMPLALWAWLRGLKKFQKSKIKKQNCGINFWWGLSALALGINLYTFHAGRAFALLVLPVMLWWTWKELGMNIFLRSMKVFVWPLLVLLVFLVPMFVSLLSGSSARGLDVAVFNPTDNWKVVGDNQYEAVKSNVPILVARFFDNKVVYVVRKIWLGYITYLGSKFLFIDGPSDGTYGLIPGVGLLYWFELPLILFALFSWIRKPDRSLGFILILLFLAPIPGALTKGGGLVPTRASAMLPFIHVLSGYGLVVSFEFLFLYGRKFWKKFSPRILLFFYGAIVLMSFAFFWENYVIHAPRIQSKQMSYGWNKAVPYIQQIEDGYDEIIVSRKYTEPQIFIMFYGRLDPRWVQQQSPAWLEYQKKGLSFVDMLGEYRLGKFRFLEIQTEHRKQPNTLLIARPEDFLVKPKGLMKEILRPGFPEEKPAIWIVDSLSDS